MITPLRSVNAVRMLVPPIALRRELDRRLVEFFRHQRMPIFRQAIADFCRYYALRSARIDWFEYLDWGKAAGKTFEDGRIHLIHPENWKRGRIYNTERMWVQTVYHELGHYLFWSDAERKADLFSARMVRGLRRTPSRVKSAKRRASAPRRRSTSGGPRRTTASKTRPTRRRAA